LLLASVFGSLQRSYLSGAVGGWSRIAARSAMAIGNFNSATELNASASKATVELKDLKALEQQLKEFGPDALRTFKRNARRVGTPARDALRSVFRSVGTAGPLGSPRRPGRRYDKMATSYNGRLSYMTSYIRNYSSKGIDINYKNRNEGRALQQLKTAKDGTISVVRLLVKAPAFIVADMAGKSNSSRIVSGPVREYKTNLFGRGVVQANDAMRQMTPARYEARAKWLQALDRQAHNRRQNKASRYAWPTMENYMSKHKVNVATLLNEVIADTNKRLGN
jgi:hypothetical protein